MVRIVDPPWCIVEHLPSPRSIEGFRLGAVPPKPRDEIETQIAARLRAFRQRRNQTMRQFAASSGIPAGTLKAYEAGRAALSWESFLKIAEAYRLNGAWLLTGEGFAMTAFNPALKILPSPEHRFSDTFRAILAAQNAVSLQPVLDPVSLRALAAKLAEKLTAAAALSHADQRAMLETEGLNEALTRVAAALAPILASAPQETARDGGFIAQLIARLSVAPPAKPLTAGEKDSEEIKLHTSAITEYSPGMSKAQAELQQLLSRARKAASAAGKRTELARYLGVKLQRVSEWLSLDKDAPKPGGEYTLQIQRWVALEEQK